MGINEIQRKPYNTVNGIHINKIREIADYLNIVDLAIYIAPKHVIGLAGRCYPGINSRVLELATEFDPLKFNNKHFDGVPDAIEAGWLLTLHEFCHADKHVAKLTPENYNNYLKAQKEDAILQGREKATENQKAFIANLKDRMTVKEDEADRWAVEMFHMLKAEGKI